MRVGDSATGASGVTVASLGAGLRLAWNKGRASVSEYALIGLVGGTARLGAGAIFSAGAASSDTGARTGPRASSS